MKWEVRKKTVVKKVKRVCAIPEQCQLLVMRSQVRMKHYTKQAKSKKIQAHGMEEDDDRIPEGYIPSDVTMKKQNTKRENMNTGGFLQDFQYIRLH